MDSKVKLYLERAENEVLLAKVSLDISMKKEIKSYLKIPEDKTFFNDVISQCYYTIFYAAKAYLLSKNITTSAPEEHKKTYDAFADLVAIGHLDKQLLNIYQSEREKAEVLLSIFQIEKQKRGRFTYHVNANANIPYAEESLAHAKTFASILNALLEKNHGKRG